MAEIRIENQRDLYVWKVDVKKLAKDMRVLVDDGCVAFAYVNGSKINEFYPSEEKLLNEDNGLVKKYGHKLDVCFYVFNDSSNVNVKWGIGRNPVTYSDRRLHGMTLSMTAYGFCKIIVSNAGLLMQHMPQKYIDDGKVSGEEIAEFVQRDLISKISPLISAQLAAIGDYSQILARREDIAKKISYGISNLEDYGLRVSETVIEGLDFTDEARLAIAKGDDIAAAKIKTEITLEEAAQAKMMHDAVADDKKIEEQ